VPRGVVDETLASHGLERRVARTVSSFLVAPHLLVDTDFVLTISRRMAELIAPRLGLVQRKPPVAPDGFTIRLAWHRRHHEDAEHRFVRERFIETARAGA
jgi:DNA-binding transcriptional LysR family regulator